MTLLEAALAWRDAGLAVVPTRTTGEKVPAVPWKQYQGAAPTREQVTTWFTTMDTDGVGAVTGAGSGCLEMFEAEGRAHDLFAQVGKRMADAGHGDLWKRLTRGYLETTPSGGIHCLYRVDGPAAPNTKLARRPATADELAANPADKIKVLLETRGQGGFTVLAPSAGRTHPTGGAWSTLLGDPTTIPTITVDERDILFAVAATFDLMPTPDLPRTTTLAPPDGSVRPGDDYNARATWDELLGGAGWTKTKRIGHGFGWTRPGKPAGAGISATTGQSDDADRLYVFTTSTEFEPSVPYSKFGAFAVLHCGGNYEDAARELAKQGYGKAATRLEPMDDLAGLIAPTNGDATSWPSTAALGAGMTSTMTTSGGGIEPGDGASPATAPALDPAPTADEREATPDQDNTALLLVDAHAQQIRYATGRKTWLTWVGHRWAVDERELVREHARALARRLPSGEGWDRYKKSALTSKGVGDVVRLAQSDQRIVVPAGQLDAQPYSLNTPAGIVDLRTGEMGPPDPAAMHTRSTTVAPDFDAPHPTWDRFLSMTFAGDPDMIAFIARAIGMSLVGTVLDQVFFFAHGAGANGKSTFLSTIQHVVGLGAGGYSGQAPAEMLLATRNHGHPTELARLQGQRLTVTSEINDGQTFDEARIKLLTGKDTISARFMRADLFDFTPTHTLWVLSNHEPEVRVGGLAFWRRVVMVPFVHTVPEADRIKDLEERLIADEGPAILAWAIRGAADYFRRGLAAPEAVQVATKAYESEQDTIAGFVSERCETGSPNAQHMTVRSSVLRAAYERWCAEAGGAPVSARTFTMRLRAKYGVQPSKGTGGTRFLSGIRLNDVSDDEYEAPPEAPLPDAEAPLWSERDGW